MSGMARPYADACAGKLKPARVTRMAFTPQPGRDAQPTIDGYVYQVVATVLARFNLAKANILSSKQARTSISSSRRLQSMPPTQPVGMQKVHKRSRTITLRSRKTVQSIVNFCAHRKTNPDTVLKLQFLMTAKPGREKGWRVPGIVTWEGMRIYTNGGKSETDDSSRQTLFLLLTCL